MKDIITYGRFHCAELSPHRNRGMEITYIEKGLMEWMVEGNPEKVEPDSIFYTLPWQVHGSLNPREPDNTIWHVLFHLDEDYPEPRNNFRLSKNLGFNRDEMHTLSKIFCSSRRHCFPATDSIRMLMPALIKELQSSHTLRETHSSTLLRAVLVELKRIVAGELTSENALSFSEQKVQRLIHSLPDRCDQNWTLERMSEHTGIQRTQINSLFQKMTGCTPMEYLLRLRIERAKSLLRETDIKIIDIAMACGIGSSQYFANVFRQATGVTPSSYRQHVSSLSKKESDDWKQLPFRSEAEERSRVEAFSNKRH